LIHKCTIKGMYFISVMWSQTNKNESIVSKIHLHPFLLEAADANAFLSLTFCDLHFSFLEIDSGCTIKGMYFISLVTGRL
jgi:hypothetical protein